MSEPSVVEENPLVRELKERGYQGYVAWLRGPGGAVERGEVRDLTAEGARQNLFGAIARELALIPDGATVDVARPKRGKDGKVELDEDGDVKFTTKRVRKRDERRRELLAQHQITEAQMTAWEASRVGS